MLISEKNNGAGFGRQESYCMTEALNSPINHGAGFSAAWVENLGVEHVPCFGGSDWGCAAGDALKCPLPSAAPLLIPPGAPGTHIMPWLKKDKGGSALGAAEPERN